eukprot:4720947-Prymnesium_polylepis.1
MLGDKDAGITRAQVREVVTMYRDYLSQQEYIDKVFKKHDVDSSSMLEQTELLALLCELVPDAETDQDDVDFILEQCDVNGDRKVDRRELLPLLGVWMVLGADKATNLAEARLKEQKAQEELKERTADGDGMAKRPVIAAVKAAGTGVKEIGKRLSTETGALEEGALPPAEEPGRYGKDALEKTEAILAKSHRKQSFTGPAAVTDADGNLQEVDHE